MDKLKKYIDSHRDEFDDVNLPEGHFERFEQKLPLQKKARSHRMYFLYGVAAAACISLLLIFKPSTDLYPDENNPTANICEIEELQLYYTMQINDVIAKMETLYEQSPTPGTSELMAATQEVLKDSNRFEERILPTLPCSEEGLFAMNQHYENSLSSLHNMLIIMENVVDTDN